MYPISPLFDEYLRRRDREFFIKVNIDGKDYTSKEIINFSIENSLTLSEEFELGNAILSQLTLRLRTLDEIPPNARVVPYVALSLANMRWIDAYMHWDDAKWPWTGNVTEWLPLGEFYVDTREQKNNFWEFACLDRLVWADVSYISQLEYPATMQDVWDEICDSLGYTYDSSVQINPSYMIQAGPAGYSKRQIIYYIAGASASSAYVGKDGVLKFKRFAAADTTPQFEMRTSDYFRVKQTNPVKQFTRFVVVYNTEEGYFFEAGEGDEDHTLHMENPFVTQDIVNDLHSTMNGFAYLPIVMDAAGFPQLEVGDVINFDKNDSKPWFETFSTWEGTELPWTGINGYQSIILHQVIEFRGGLKMRIEAPAKSAQRSEFVVEGSLTAAVNKLNKNALREGHSYYGATLTREQGLIIEREDHFSKLTLNSDKMAWEVNGVDSLHYDAIAKKLKYKGDIEMEGGSISWTSVNAPTPIDVGALPVNDLKLNNLDSIGNYIGALSQGQVEGLSTRLTKIMPNGVYTGTVGTDQLIAGSALIGAALIEQLVVGGNVQIGTAQDAAGVTTIIGNTVNTGYVNALGVQADSVKAGWVYSGKVTTDQLETGFAKISAAMIENLVVGGNVTMGPNASISWATQVTGKPFIPSSASDVGAVAANQTAVFNTLTNFGSLQGLFMSGGQLYVNADYINAGTINGNRINGGTLSGVTINVSTNATIGKYLILDGDAATAGISWGPLLSGYPSITYDPTTQRLKVYSAGSIYANERRIDVSPVAVFA